MYLSLLLNTMISHYIEILYYYLDQYQTVDIEFKQLRTTLSRFPR
jgi:hypothetical protein